MVMILIIILQEFVSSVNTNYPPLAPSKKKYVGQLLNYDLYMDFLFRQNLLDQLHNFRIFYDTRPALTVAGVAAYEL
jgi:hypothetical protein